MQVKLFEVRDRSTFVPAIGVSLGDPANEQERYLLRRSGFPVDCNAADGFVLFGRLVAGLFEYAPHHWPENPRTMREAHKIVLRDWDELESGDVIDVEFELGETTAKKLTENEREYT